MFGISGTLARFGASGPILNAQGQVGLQVQAKAFLTKSSSAIHVRITRTQDSWREFSNFGLVIGA